MANNVCWIGVDLDGTLAEYHGWEGIDCIGDPVGPMCDRVREWLEEGMCVKIFTARVSAGQPPHVIKKAVDAIDAFCMREFGCKLEVTCQKDYAMTELWDDCCVQVEFNTGRRVDRKD